MGARLPVLPSAHSLTLPDPAPPRSHAPTHPPAQVSVMDFGGAGQWLRLAIDDTGGRAAVTSVAVRGAGDAAWRELTNTWGAAWELPSAPQPPLSFRVRCRRCCCCWGGSAGSRAGRGQSDRQAPQPPQAQPPAPPPTPLPCATATDCGRRRRGCGGEGCGEAKRRHWRRRRRPARPVPRRRAIHHLRPSLLSGRRAQGGGLWGRCGVAQGWSAGAALAELRSLLHPPAALS